MTTTREISFADLKPGQTVRIYSEFPDGTKTTIEGVIHNYKSGDHFYVGTTMLSRISPQAVQRILLLADVEPPIGSIMCRDHSKATYYRDNIGQWISSLSGNTCTWSELSEYGLRVLRTGWTIGDSA